MISHVLHIVWYYDFCGVCCILFPQCWLYIMQSYTGRDAQLCVVYRMPCLNFITLLWLVLSTSVKSIWSFHGKGYPDDGRSRFLQCYLIFSTTWQNTPKDHIPIAILHILFPENFISKQMSFQNHSCWWPSPVNLLPVQHNFQ
jgi:hypothetical protein